MGIFSPLCRLACFNERAGPLNCGGANERSWVGGDNLYINVASAAVMVLERYVWVTIVYVLPCVLLCEDSWGHLPLDKLCQDVSDPVVAADHMTSKIAQQGVQA